TATDDYGTVDSVQFSLNGTTQSLPVVSTAFSQSVQLSQGNNSLLLTAVDEAGNVATASAEVFLDTIPPVVTIQSPANHYQSASASVVVSGAITDDGPIQNTAQLSVNGTATMIPVGSNGTFGAPVSLKAGPNQVIVTAYDQAGNLGTSQTWTISYQAGLSTALTASIEGYAFDYASGAPIAGIQVTSSSGATATTNDLGKFFMETLPGTQSVHLASATYTSADRTAAPLPDETVDIATAYLTKLDTKSTYIQPAAGGTVVNSAQNAELIVPPGAIASAASVSITLQDSCSLPGLLPAGAVPVSFADMQPSGLQFSQFATLRLPNRKNYPPGTPVPCSYWDVKNQVWAGVGGGAVTSDGKYLEIPINHFSSYGFFVPPPATGSTPPPLQTPAPTTGTIPGPCLTYACPGGDGPLRPTPSTCPRGLTTYRGFGLGSNVDVVTGNHSLDYRLRGLPSFGLSTEPVLTYNSKNRTRVLPLRYHFGNPTLVAGTEPLTQINWTLTVAGRTFAGSGPDVQVNWDTRDATGQYVEPGLYQVTLSATGLTVNPQISANGPTFTFEAYVQGPGSRYGVGWTLNDDMRMVIQAPATGSD
ncbi:MAG: hypothetical protein KGR26_10585, partial [Cyanobacteria bacterium REEB65]|nr:hypothetical protein [Cyanobacteria bacterium REEB65]